MATTVFHFPDTTRLSKLPQLHLVMDFFHGEERLHWSAAEMTSAAFAQNDRIFLVYTRRLWDHFTNRRQMKNVTLKIPLWNPSKQPIHFGGFYISKIVGNPMYYSQLLERP